MSELYHADQPVQLPLFDTLQAPISNLKVCNTCGIERSLDLFPQHPDGRYRTFCKICRRRQKRENYVVHREQRQQHLRDYQAAHMEQAIRRSKTYRATHYEKVRHRERKYEDAHREEKKQRNKAWRQANPMKHNENIRRYNARKKGASVEAVNYTYILERDGHFCYICEGAILPHHIIHFDHVIPLARGGAHSEENIKPTHDACNLRKSDRLPSELEAWHKRGVAE
jgi:5-methylcytosine-specific restriction endonuclease McrA